MRVILIEYRQSHLASASIFDSKEKNLNKKFLCFLLRHDYDSGSHHRGTSCTTLHHHPRAVSTWPELDQPLWQQLSGGQEKWDHMTVIWGLSPRQDITPDQETEEEGRGVSFPTTNYGAKRNISKVAIIKKTNFDQPYKRKDRIIFYSLYRRQHYKIGVIWSSNQRVDRHKT